MCPTAPPTRRWAGPRAAGGRGWARSRWCGWWGWWRRARTRSWTPPRAPAPAVSRRWPEGWPARSEEHTSELQSRGHLVCRLLLETKKNFVHEIEGIKKHQQALYKGVNKIK